MRRIGLLAALAALLLTAAASSAALPLAPISSLGKLAPAPATGPKGPEAVPIPKAPVFANVASPKLNQTIDGVTCQQAEKVAFHIHAHLVIVVDGKQRQIPYGVGIGQPVTGVQTTVGAFAEGGSCFMWLHTHASDGIIHEEAPRQMSFTLGQFFAVWGLTLSKTQIGPETGKVTTIYDGKVWTGNPDAVPLTGGAQIELEIGKPLVAPEHIVFPKALLTAMKKAK